MPTGIWIRPSLFERFESKYIPEPMSGCWIWICAYQGSDPKWRYGHLNISGRSVAAHQVAWQLFCGVIPDGLFVCHRCDNTFCVNPRHLFLGTNSENIKDCVAKGRLNHPRRTHCLKGHPFRQATKRNECPTCHGLRHGYRKYEAPAVGHQQLK